MILNAENGDASLRQVEIGHGADFSRTVFLFRSLYPVWRWGCDGLLSLNSNL